MHKLTYTLIFLLCLLRTPAAHAYLDPSTGSMVISAIVGLFASIALAVKTYWYRIRKFFAGKPDKGAAGSDEPGS